MDLAIEAHALEKSYGRRAVLHGVDVRVEAGSVFALLGPNGAGKTTTVRILATLCTADGGSALVAGHDVAAEQAQVRRRIALTGQYAAVDEQQTGRENLELMGTLRRLGRGGARARADELVEQFGLADAADRRVGTYSGGMRRRLDIAAGLVVRPEVLFLDEPTTGLDPRSRMQMWDLVAELAASGVTVFLTTQYLDEADRLAGRIAVIDDGTVVAEGTADELKRRVAGHRLDLFPADAAAFEEVLSRLGPRAVHVDRAAGSVGLATEGDARSVRAALDDLDPTGERIARFAVHSASLDDVFLTLTGRPADAQTEEPCHV
jgi:ABC-2 type transport system ATP-binding protein